MNAREAWDECMDELESMYRIANMHASKHHVGDELTTSEDDEGMQTASDDDLIAWVDDLDSRVGYDVATFRACILEYCEVRALERLQAAGYICEGEPMQDSFVVINGGMSFDCYIDAAHTLLGEKSCE